MYEKIAIIYSRFFFYVKKHFRIFAKLCIMVYWDFNALICRGFQYACREYFFDC